MIEACGWALDAAGSGRSVIKVFPSVTPARTAEGASGLQHRTRAGGAQSGRARSLRRGVACARVRDRRRRARRAARVAVGVNEDGMRPLRDRTAP